MNKKNSNQSDVIGDLPQEKKPGVSISGKEITTPEIITVENFSDVINLYEKNKATIKDELHLNFKSTKRITSSGMKSMCKFSEDLAAKDVLIYIDDIDNDVFKALKITGNQPKFRFVHQGEYKSRNFASGGPRC